MNILEQLNIDQLTLIDVAISKGGNSPIAFHGEGTSSEADLKGTIIYDLGYHYAGYAAYRDAANALTDHQFGKWVGNNWLQLSSSTIDSYRNMLTEVAS